MVKHRSVQIWKYYEIRDGKLVRRNKMCPRCGSFMAEHRDRRTCGKCGYTEFKVGGRG